MSWIGKLCERGLKKLALIRKSSPSRRHWISSVWYPFYKVDLVLVADMAIIMQIKSSAYSCRHLYVTMEQMAITVIYLIKHPGRLFNFLALRVGASSGWVLI